MLSDWYRHQFKKIGWLTTGNTVLSPKHASFEPSIVSQAPMEAGGSEEWGEMLDRLSACITRQEEAALSQAIVNTGSPSHQTDLHTHVAALLVKHGITTWAHLQASFPGAASHPCNEIQACCFAMSWAVRNQAISSDYNARVKAWKRQWPQAGQSTLRAAVRWGATAPLS